MRVSCVGSQPLVWTSNICNPKTSSLSDYSPNLPRLPGSDVVLGVIVLGVGVHL